MLYIIGLGLGNEKDITLRGLEAVKACDKVYIESYTSLLSFGISSDGLSTLVCTPIRIPFCSTAQQFAREKSKRTNGYWFLINLYCVFNFLFRKNCMESR